MDAKLARKSNDCLVESELCLPEKIEKHVKKIVGETKKEKILEKLDCDDVVCLVNKLEKKVKDIKTNNFLKPMGPSKSTELINDKNIFDIMNKLSLIYNLKEEKYFYPHTFKFIDFMNFRDSRIDLSKIFRDGYKYTGMIVNTDSTGGGGIHWFAFFADFILDENERPKIKTDVGIKNLDKLDKESKKELIDAQNQLKKTHLHETEGLTKLIFDKLEKINITLEKNIPETEEQFRKKNYITLEYFNSSGMAPRDIFQEWLEKESIELEKEFNVPVKIIFSNGSRRQQMSNTECGVYSLYYIWSRLEGKYPYYFLKNKIIKINI